MTYFTHMLVTILGFVFLFAACDVGRGPDSKVKRYGKLWLIQMVLITLGVFLTSIGNPFPSGSTTKEDRQRYDSIPRATVLEQPHPIRNRPCDTTQYIDHLSSPTNETP
jgi:hypothetical protein